MVLMLSEDWTESTQISRRLRFYDALHLNWIRIGLSSYTPADRNNCGSTDWNSCINPRYMNSQSLEITFCLKKITTHNPKLKIIYYISEGRDPSVLGLNLTPHSVSTQEAFKPHLSVCLMCVWWSRFTSIIINTAVYTGCVIAHISLLPNTHEPKVCYYASSLIFFHLTCIIMEIVWWWEIVVHILLCLNWLYVEGVTVLL